MDPVAAPRRLPRNLSPAVPCPLPGYEGLAARFVVSLSRARVDACGEDMGALAALAVAELAGWDFVDDAGAPIPPPTAGDAASFSAAPLDLLIWLCRGGYQAGLQAAIATKN